MSLLLIPFYYIKAVSFSHTAEHRLENVPDAFKQMANNGVIIAATVCELSPQLWATVGFIWRKPVFRVCYQVIQKPACSATETSKM